MAVAEFQLSSFQDKSDDVGVVVSCSARDLPGGSRVGRIGVCAWRRGVNYSHD